MQFTSYKKTWISILIILILIIGYLSYLFFHENSQPMKNIVSPPIKSNKLKDLEFDKNKLPRSRCRTQ